MTSIRPVILSGGSGSRLWPLSSAHRPKQFLALTGDQSLYEETLHRASLLSDLEPLIVTGAGLVDLVLEHTQGDVVIVVEPAPRNTAAAIVAAALVAGPDEVLVVLPADHLVADPESFVRSITKAVAVAESDGVVTLGVVPTRPETGYGWIKVGEGSVEDGYQIERFVEKPPEELANAMLADGNHLWNSGVFVGRSSVLVTWAERLIPEVVSAIRTSLPESPESPILLSSAFEEAPSVSFDSGVMERLPLGYVIPLDAGWSDVGSWVGVWENVDHDESGNAVRGDVVAMNSTNSLAWSSRRPIALVGLDGVVVVETDEGILVASMDSGQAIKAIVERLNERSGDDE